MLKVLQLSVGDRVKNSTFVHHICYISLIFTFTIWHTASICDYVMLHFIILTDDEYKDDFEDDKSVSVSCDV